MTHCIIERLLMEILYFALGVTLGIIGCVLTRSKWHKTSDIPLQQYNDLLRSEAVAKQNSENLKAEKDDLSNHLIKMQESLYNLNKESAINSEKLSRLITERDEDSLELEYLRELKDKNLTAVTELKGKISLLESEKNSVLKQLETERDFITKSEERSKLTFENIANQVIDKKSKAFNEHVEKGIENVLKPLKIKIGEFEQKVDSESKERYSLKNEIVKLVEAADRSNESALSLANAIRGDSRTQGDWGEHLVEMILESAGLVAERDFFAQYVGEGQSGERLKPDFLINLPQNKHIIVDAKVSLKAYEAFKIAADDVQKEEALAAHLKSIRSHINDLESKHYSKIKGVNSPDFVFLFVAVEPAYLAAMQFDQGLFTYAQNKGVILVTASTLLASLKTVAYVWLLEKQQKNSQEIAIEAGKLYDKFVGFLEEFEKIEKIFITGQTHYQSAMSRLKNGPGNVFRKLEMIRELGANPSKRIKQDLIDTSDSIIRSEDMQLSQAPLKHSNNS